MKSGYKAILAAGIALSGAGAGPSTSKEAATESVKEVPGRSVYSVDFDKAALSDIQPMWSVPTFDKSIPGHAILGRFMDETEVLTLKNLPAHKFLRIKVQLIIVDSWDGSMARQQWVSAPDCMSIELGDGRTLMFASFINYKFGDTIAYQGKSVQSYPDNYPLSENPGYTDSSAQNVAWVRKSRNQYGSNAIYDIEFAFPHSADDVKFEFKAYLKEPAGEHVLENESWGLGKAEVQTYDKPPVELTAAQVQKLYGKLASPSPAEAINAMRTLISAGDAVVDDLAKCASPQVVDLHAVADRLIADLDDDSYPIRQAAEEEIIQRGREMLPYCREALAVATSQEVQARLHQIIEKMPTGTVNKQAARLRRALEIIGTEKAVALGKQACPSPVVPDISELR